MNFRHRAMKKDMTKVFAAGAAAGALTIAAIGAMGEPASAQAPRLLSPPLAADGTLSFADLVEEVSPSVVSILVEQDVEAPRLPSQIEEFFEFRFGERGSPFNGEPRTLEMLGSGFFIDADGHVVTNNHVIENADRVRVRLNGGEELEAEVVGADAETDLAVLKVKSDKKIPYVAFAEDVNLRVGDWVVAVGNPFGLSGTVTSGIVSAIGRNTPELSQSIPLTDFIQIDAPINRGNSGGPTFDLKGRVVGVNTAIYSRTGGSVGIGFAIPARVAKRTIDQLIANGSVSRGWLGVSLQEVTTELAAALNRKNSNGALVNEVLDGTPAAEAGLTDGDLIVALDGKSVDDVRDVIRNISSLSPGEKVKVKVLRDGKEKVLNVTLGKRDLENLTAANDNSSKEDGISEDLGLRVSELNSSLREQFRVPEGVKGVLVTGVRPGSPAAEAGLRNGSVILEVDGDGVTSPDALKLKIEQAQKSGREALLVRSQIGDRKQFGALPLETDE